MGEVSSVFIGGGTFQSSDITLSEHSVIVGDSTGFGAESENVHRYLIKDFGSSIPDGYVELLDGSGGSITYNTTLAVASGTASSKASRVYYEYRITYGIFEIELALSDGNSEAKAFFGISDYNTTYTNYPANRVGWRVGGGDDGVDASNSNGQTETVTADVDTNTGTAKTYKVGYHRDKIEFFVNGSLVATHTTNMISPETNVQVFNVGYQTGGGAVTEGTVTISRLMFR